MLFCQGKIIDRVLDIMEYKLNSISCKCIFIYTCFKKNRSQRQNKTEILRGRGEVVLTLLPGWPNLVHCNLKYCNIGYSNHIQYLRLQGLNYLELQIDSDFIPDIYETLNCLISLSLIIFESIHVQLWFKKKTKR